MSKTARGKRGRRRFTLALAALALLASVAVWAAAKTKAKSAADEALPPAAQENPATKADIVHITIQTVPPRKAQVKWGGKSLGVIPVPRPLVIERPRDSGPLDLVIRAPGFLPVHSRAYTFNDSRVSVKLTPPSEKNKLFGYREEPPPPNPDAGVPPDPGATVAPTP